MRTLLGSLALAALTLAGTARAEDEAYKVSIDAQPAKVGSAATARVTVTALGDRHINKDFPTSLKLVAPAGVDLPKPALTNKDGGAQIAEKTATFDVPYTAREAGRKVIAGDLKFAVCTATTCDPRKEKVAINVEAR